VLKEKPKKGQIGQPPVPLSLNPDGAFSVGLKIGRRSADLMLLDLAGGVRGTMRYAYRYPTPQDTMRLFSEGFDIITGDLAPAQAARICGVGIAAPFEIWNWESEVGAPHDVLRRGAASISRRDRKDPRPRLSVYDATAACAGADLWHRQPLSRLCISSSGRRRRRHRAEWQLYQGRNGNAGRFAHGRALPAPRAVRSSSSAAHPYALERSRRRSISIPCCCGRTAAAGEFRRTADEWLDEAVAALATAALSTVAAGQRSCHYRRRNAQRRQAELVAAVRTKLKN
jgi:hypothetical protein